MSNIETTQWKYTVKNTDGSIKREQDGTPIYDEIRSALHQEIINYVLAGKEPSSDPVLLVLAGGVGSGRSAYARLLLGMTRTDKELDPFLPPESTVIIRPKSFIGLSEFRENINVRHPEKLPILVDEFYDLTEKIVREATKRGINVVFNNHGEDAERMKNLVRMAKEKGYDTIAQVMTCSVDGYFDIVHRRSSDGMINDHRRALEEHRDVSRNFDIYTQLFHATLLMDVDHSPPRLIYRTTQEEILDNQSFLNFLQKAYIDVEGKNAEEAKRPFYTLTSRELRNYFPRLGACLERCRERGNNHSGTQITGIAREGEGRKLTDFRLSARHSIMHYNDGMFPEHYVGEKWVTRQQNGKSNMLPQDKQDYCRWKASIEQEQKNQDTPSSSSNRSK